MEQPTQEQIRKFWEWCGFQRLEYLDGCWHQRLEPGMLLALPIDLNNLFKYAVPFLLEEHAIIETYSFKQESGLYYSETGIWDRDERQLKGKLVSKAFAQDWDLEKVNALALFWALWKVKEAH